MLATKTLHVRLWLTVAIMALMLALGLSADGALAQKDPAGTSAAGSTPTNQPTTPNQSPPTTYAHKIIDVPFATGQTFDCANIPSTGIEKQMNVRADMIMQACTGR